MNVKKVENQYVLQKKKKNHYNHSFQAGHI